MKTSQMIAVLQKALKNHGDRDLLVLDEELGEWRDVLWANPQTVAVWRDGSPIVKAVTIYADYDR